MFGIHANNSHQAAEISAVKKCSFIGRHAQNQQGFSLVELMVGLVIGLLATLVIMQTFSVFEGQKRTTSGNTDAQTNGSVALYSLQRDVQLAGYGLPMFDVANMPLKCTTPAPDADADGIADVDNDGDPGTPNVDLLPLEIVDGGNLAGATDVVTVRYGSSASGGAPVKVTSKAGLVVCVKTTIGCKNNDIVYFVKGGSCYATRVNGAPVGNTITVLDANGATPPNPPPAPPDDASDFSCLGDWREVTFQVNTVTNELERQETSQRAANQGVSGIPTPVVAGVVNIQAQYGISSKPEDNKIDRWVNATGVWANPGNVSLDCNAANANRNCIKAVRVAVVARTNLYEKELVSTACSSTTAAGPTGVCAWDATSADPNGVGWAAPVVDLSNTAGWDHYRYRVYETIIPIRNIVWTKERLEE